MPADSSSTENLFTVDTSPQPEGHPPLTPEDGAEAIRNPPSMVWRVDERAASYVVEMSRNPDFRGDVVRVTGIDMPFYNHSEILAEGTWYWRYSVVTPEGTQSQPGPVRSFAITPRSIPMPIPPAHDLLASMPPHPRIFVTPDSLDEFRQRRDGHAAEAWVHLQYEADKHVDADPPSLDLGPVPADLGDSRGQVFYMVDGRPMYPSGYGYRDLNADAGKANTLSFAYLITEDDRYAEAAKRWALHASDFRVDCHLEDRGQHDTVVYCYEYALMGIALAFDRLYDRLIPEEKARLLAHIEYHCEAAYLWLHDRIVLHLNYQNSHGQQCMHALFTTVLAIAADSASGAFWADYLVRQYVNRIAWGNNDGGYTEGQKYGHKVQFILQALSALKTAAGIDLFQDPRWRNTGDFWLYCMSMNYWWNHWGDCYSLIDPNCGSDADTYITDLLASMTGNRTVKWWSDTRVCNPDRLPFWYLSSSGVVPKPPVDIPQARLFPEVGQLAAYDRFHDHRSNRIFFRSSPWGSHSHAHCDQNGFVIHAGGEILACDAGYYTYYGDDYHGQWSMRTYPHNTILVNGESQPKSITARGEVAAFFNTPDACFFVGDASDAYEDRLRRFDRSVLFLRPDVWIVHDDLEAPEPSDYTWLLNTFEAAEIDERARSLTVRQRDQRLLVQHLAPDELDYSQDNQRPYPMKTRAFTRFTEDFPQPWNIRVKTVAKNTHERILACMHAYDRSSGPLVEGIERIDAANALGLRFRRSDCCETALFRSSDSGAMSVDGVETDARVLHIVQNEEGDALRWLVHAATVLTVGGTDLFRADAPCDAALSFDRSGAAAQVCLQHDGPVTISLKLPEKSGTVLQARPNEPDRAVSIPFVWSDGTVNLSIASAGETVLWIDPVVDFAAPLLPLTFTVEDSEGSTSVEFEAAFADNGDVIAFGELSPRESGVYEIAAEGAEILVQDRWDSELSVHGADRATAVLREGVEVFFRYASDASPDVRAVLKESHRGKLVNLLYNGGFEAGVRDYPPRGWNVQYPRAEDVGWPEWSQDDPAEGVSCLRHRLAAARTALTSRPMRLRTAGRYLLRFKARGTAEGAVVSVSGQRGTQAKVPIEPGEAWHEHRAELDVQPGYCLISINWPGGEPGRVLWVDDMAFGYIAE